MSRCAWISAAKSASPRRRFQFIAPCFRALRSRSQVDIRPKHTHTAGRMSIRKRTDGEYSAHLQGTLDLLILRTLIFGPQHGQGIARAIQQTSEDTLLVEHGALYPALQRLEAQGWIAARWGTSANNRKARFYTLTQTGRKQLVKESTRWRRLSTAIGRILGPEAKEG